MKYDICGLKFLLFKVNKECELYFYQGSYFSIINTILFNTIIETNFTSRLF